MPNQQYQVLRFLRQNPPKLGFFETTLTSEVSFEAWNLLALASSETKSIGKSSKVQIYQLPFPHVYRQLGALFLSLSLSLKQTTKTKTLEIQNPKQCLKTGMTRSNDLSPVAISKIIRRIANRRTGGGARGRGGRQNLYNWIDQTSAWFSRV
jgi:hypothetical protein